MNVRYHLRPFALSDLREHLRDTFWFAPAAGLVGAFMLWWGVSTLDSAIVTHLRVDKAYRELGDLASFANDARTVVTTVSAAMMTFIGVVFSISLVAVQMASGQLTPRIVRIFVRSRITKLTLTVFLATFVFSLLVLTSYESETEVARLTSVPVLQSLLTLAMVALSLLLFITYVSSTLRLLQVGPVVDRIVHDSLRALDHQPKEEHREEATTAPGQAPLPLPLPAESGRVPYGGRAGVLRDVDAVRLVGVARRRGVVLRLLPRMGDFVVPGMPLLAVHGGDGGGTGGDGGGSGRTVPGDAVSVGVERTLRRDPSFGLRQLTDIALHALSAAVNDPTTAVQCLDRTVQFLAALAHRPLGTVRHRDHRGEVRLVVETPDWADLVDLAFEEVRRCVPEAGPQVTRRVLAGLDDLLLVVPQERAAPLLRHRALLVLAVERTSPEHAERTFSLVPDRKGIG
ncbi:DUF2254 domain-containing protein [Streptomyces sp. NBC_00102]|uniref:DUF2254 domain-containing protein n=1 Tax=Streptomyces sp. NBC_00102 TaxID=2975652 RepID=UPI002253EAAB|nr:DUF2254 domain-containing protein [Streptomyces sp. NBC_00102]MCX5400964.1 DUF2254 domain-containing protein [Streptomyces sp. NBC_00102]